MADEFETQDEQQPSPAVTPAAPTPSPSPDVTVEKLQRQYNGLQGAFNKEKKRGDELVIKLDTTTTEYETQVNTLAAERDALAATQQALQEQLTAAQTKAAKLEKEKSIGTTVRRDFPALAELFDEGLLLGIDGLEGDALTTYLTQYQEKLGVIRDNMIRNKTAGATPSAPSGQKTTAAMTQEDAKKNLQSVISQGFGQNTPEYKEAFQAYRETLVPPTSSN